MSLKRGLAVLCIAAMALGPLGCVDVPSTGPQLPDYRSVYRFIYAANDANPGQLLVDGSSVGTLNVGQATAYLDLPAGSRRLAVAGKDTVSLALVTDRKGTVLVFTKAGVVRSFLDLKERYVYETVGATVPAGTALVRIANGLSDGTNSQSVDVARVTGVDTVGVLTGLDFGDVSGYAEVPAGAHTLLITAAGGNTVVATVAVNATSKSRHLGVVFGTPGAGSAGVFQEQ